MIELFKLMYSYRHAPLWEVGADWYHIIQFFNPYKVALVSGIIAVYLILNKRFHKNPLLHLGFAMVYIALALFVKLPTLANLLGYILYEPCLSNQCLRVGCMETYYCENRSAKDIKELNAPKVEKKKPKEHVCNPKLVSESLTRQYMRCVCGKTFTLSEGIDQEQRYKEWENSL